MAEAAEFQGTPSAARRWFRRTATLLAGVPLLAGAVQLPAASAAPAGTAVSLTHAQNRTAGTQTLTTGTEGRVTGTASRTTGTLGRSATGSRTVDVMIKSLTPTTPSADDTVKITGTVTNNGRSTITQASVALRIGPPMNSRTAIDDAARRTGYSPGLDGVEIGGKYARNVGRLPAGGSRHFALSVPVAQLHLGRTGAYQIGVALTGQTAEQGWQQVLGIQRTFLPWQPSTAPAKSRLTFLWPLVSSTHLTARTDTDEQQTPIFREDDLKAELGPGGRLQQLVTLGKDLPVTWVIDPDLLATVDAMTRGYEVEAEDDTTVPGEGQEVAEQWLNDLQHAVQGKQVIALPFADPDLASLAHRGKNSGALSHLQTATELASTTVETILHLTPRTDFAWPVDGAIDSAIVDVATSAGAHNVITRSDSLKETGGLLYTPSAARQIGSGNTAVVADARLSTAFAGDMSRSENYTLAVQRFLAQSQMFTLQAPKQRSVVVAPQRMPTASQAQAMAAALGGLSGRWSQPQTLGQAAKAKPDPAATQRVPSGQAYPRSLRGRELPAGAFQKIQETQGALDRFQLILSAPYRVATPFGTAIMREMSTSWRGDAKEAKRFRGSVQGYLRGLTEKVRLIPKSRITLSGRSATIPVTVQNGLVQSVKGLRLRLVSHQANRLAVGEEQPIQVEGGHSQSVKFGTTANANGRVRITAQLVTADGQPYGQKMDFEVNVTEATSTVILVIAGGVLLLVLAGIRIYVQRKRGANSDESNKEGEEDGNGEGAESKERAPDKGEHEPAGDTAAPVVPGQPSDPTPDTGSQSAEPSGSGEKVDH